MNRVFESQIAFAILVYFSLFWVVSQLLFSNLAQWDMLGHFFASRNFRDSIFPDFVGWNASHFAGYPQGYFYPSLFHWIVGGTAKWIPLEIAFKFWVGVSTLAIPLALFRLFQKTYSSSPEQARWLTLVACLIYIVPKTAMGGDLYGTFKIGLVNQNWAMVFFFLFLSEWWNPKASRRQTWASGLLLGLTLLSHAIVGFAALLVVLIQFLSELIFRSLNLKKYFFLGSIGSLTAAAWLVPYFMYHQEGAGLGIRFLEAFHWIGHPSVSIPLGISTFILLFGIAVANWRNFRLRDPYTLSALGFLIFGLVCEFLYRFSSLDIEHWAPLHVYRFHYFILFFAVSASARECASPIVKGFTATAFIIISSVSAYHCVDSLRTEYNIGFNFPPGSRTLVYQGSSTLLALIAPHQLADSLQLEGHETINGLFAESSKHSRFYMSTLNELFSQPLIWGIEPLPYLPRLGYKHLNALGVDAILSKEILDDSSADPLPISAKVENLETEAIYHGTMQKELFSAYVFKIPRVEQIKNPRWIPAHWDAEVYAWWLSELPLHEVLIEGNPIQGTSLQPVHSVNVTFPTGELPVMERHSATEWVVHTHASTPDWFLIKESYFQNWKAFDSMGSEIPVRKSAPYMIAFYGSGDVTFRFSLSPLERAAQACTWLFFAIAAILFVLSLTKNPWKWGLFLLLILPKMGSAWASTAQDKIFEHLQADQLVMGQYHLCKIFADQVECWGVNHFGQLGTGLRKSTPVATRSEGWPSHPVGGSAGLRHTCFFDDHEVRCAGKLGGFETFKPQVFFQSQSKILSLTSASLGMCIETEAKPRFHCFSDSPHAFLAKLRIPDSLHNLRLGEAHACGIQTDQVWCAGENSMGQLGDQTQSPGSQFAPISLSAELKGAKAIQVEIGANHACALLLTKDREKKLICWGDNRFGQIARSSKHPFFQMPQIILPPQHSAWRSLAVGDSHTCGIASGAVFCVGDNSKHQVSPLSELLSERHFAQFTQVPYLKEVEKVLSSGLGTCILKEKHFSCWGAASNGLSR